MRHSAPGCPNYAHYWSDQAGQRLGATDSLSQLPGIREALSYTAQGQLYYAVTATDSPGDYDFNWNWYDASGLRVMAALYNQNGVTPAPQPLTLQGGTWAYYLYDGPELGLVLRRSGTTVKIQQRFVSAGVDGSLAGRFWVTGASAQSLALLTDHQGTTLAALNPNGTEAAGYVYKPLSAFGASDDPTASPSGSVAASSTGFTGASTPNATGGMVYLRNRWYDPQSGRFLTQDPIGLAGGVNLYAYAGNDPIAYTDPFGLCPPKDDQPCNLQTGDQNLDIPATRQPLEDAFNNAPADKDYPGYKDEVAGYCDSHGRCTEHDGGLKDSNPDLRVVTDDYEYHTHENTDMQDPTQPNPNIVFADGPSRADSVNVQTPMRTGIPSYVVTPSRSIV